MVILQYLLYNLSKHINVLYQNDRLVTRIAFLITMVFSTQVIKTYLPKTKLDKKGNAKAMPQTPTLPQPQP